MKQSAGILLYKKKADKLLVFLVHPGGPLWKNKDLESWTIPKGEYEPSEAPIDAALREFEEETGHPITVRDFIQLSPVRLKSGKVIHAWACEQDLDVSLVQSNTFILEWPPKSGLFQHFPEIDKGEWMDAEQAMGKINPAQQNFIRELIIKTM